MDKLTELSQQLAKLLLQQQKRLAVAESCTGGWLAKTVTDLAGSSQWFERGFVSYSNAAKQEMLGVRPQTLLRDGAVSEAVVQEMALGALRHSQADISVAISGIAGPGGAVPGKPVGTVCFSWALKDHYIIKIQNISKVIAKQCAGSRWPVRWKACWMSSARPEAPRQRLFFALWPDDAVRARLDQAGEELLGKRVKRVPAANLHLTLAFAGAVTAGAPVSGSSGG